MAEKKYDLKTIIAFLVPVLLGAGGMQTVNYAGKADCRPPERVLALEMRIDTLASRNDLYRLKTALDSVAFDMKKRAVMDSLGNHRIGEKVDTMMARIDKISRVVNQMNHVDKFGLACDGSFQNGSLARR